MRRFNHTKVIETVITTLYITSEITMLVFMIYNAVN